MRRLLRGILVPALLALGAAGLDAAGPPADDELLLEDAGSRESFAPERGVKRRKGLRLNRRARARMLGREATAADLTVPLFGGHGARFRVRRRQSGRGADLLYADLPGKPGSGAYLAAVGDAVHGELVVGPAERYRIRGDGKGGHWLEEMDPASGPGLEDDSLWTAAALSSGQGFISDPQRAYCIAGAPVDLLVVYDNKALADSGGLAPLTAQIEAQVFFGNLAYAKSGVNFSMRLVGVVAVNYTETDTSADLDRLRNTSDGHLDGVHALRNAHGADIVMMWVGTGAPYAGLAYVVNPAAAGADQSAFGLVSVAGGLRSLVHEMGHVMGLTHAYPDVGPFLVYGRGYPIPLAGGNIGTIMGGGSVGLDQFSNPSVFYDGVATGKAPPAVDAADAVGVLNLTYPYVAAYRAATVAGTPPSAALVPPDPSGLAALGSLTLVATASAGSSPVARVQFRVDNTLVGESLSPPHQVFVDRLPAGLHHVFVSAVDGAGRRSDACPVTIQVQSALPPPWREVFLSHPWNWEGQPLPAAGLVAGQYHLYGSGEMGGAADREYVVYQTLCGDGEISARVASQSGSTDWAVAALTMRKGEAAQAPFIQLSVSRHGAYQRLQRSLDGGIVDNAGLYWSVGPRWLKLTRAGNTFTPYYSSDGSAWTQGPTGPSVISMPADIMVGMAVTNFELTSNNHSVFDNVTVTSACPPSTPTPSPTETGTASPTWTASPSHTASPTGTPSPTVSPTPTVSATASVTLTPTAFRPAGRTAWGPSPARLGRQLCLHFERQPEAAAARVYSLAGDLVARLQFERPQAACWQPRALAPGIYIAVTEVTWPDGTSQKFVQKTALLP